MKIKTAIKAGNKSQNLILGNHNQGGLVVKTKLKAGAGMKGNQILLNHNQSK